jgi:hypothetical protein
LLAVSIPDLKKPDSQEISAFYLQNIYRAMYNGTAPIPSFLDDPASSPPEYIVWVNSLWLLSLLISLTGALSATLEQRCALRYISITQNGAYSSEERARIRAVFAKSEFGRFIFRDTSAIMFCLHLSLFLFMAGVLVYFFNINRATFYAVLWWIAIVTILYILLTVGPIFDPCDLLYTPFTSLALRAYLLLPRAVSQVFSSIKIHQDLRDRYSEGFIEGKTKSVEEEALKSSSTVDTEVLEKTLLALDEDHSLEAFFDAIPGFWNSNLVQKPLDDGVRTNLRGSLAGFLDRTFSSHLFTEEDRINRLRTCMKAAHSALQLHEVSQDFRDFYEVHGDENVRRMLVDACVIAYTQDRNGKWTMLLADVLGVPERVVQNYRANGDSVLLATVIHVAREALRTGRSERGVLESISQINVHNTTSHLRHDFCILWNEIVQNATREGDNSTPTQILAVIRHLFAILHQDNHPALTQFPAFLGPVDNLDAILGRPSSYPSCNVSSHLRVRVSSAEVPTTTSHSISPHTGNRARDAHRAPAPRPALVSAPALDSLPGVATQNTLPGNADTSVIDTPDPIRGSTFISGRGPQQVQGTRLIQGSLSADAAALPTPNTTPTWSSQIPVMHSQPTDTAMSVNWDGNSHTPTAPSSATTTTTALSASPRVAIVSGQLPGTNNRNAGSQDDT